MIIFAPNTHQGGGKTLLLELLSSILDQKDAILILDERLVLPAEIITKIGNIYRIKPALLERLKAELLLRKISTEYSSILCFGSLPPLLPVKGIVYVYLQNRLLTEPSSTTGYRFRVRVRTFLGWLRIKFYGSKVEYIVQSPSMKTSLKESLGLDSRVIAFTGIVNEDKTVLLANNTVKKEYDFIYVASGEPHKNHRNLVKAWCLLAELGIRPSLCLTLEENLSEQLLEWIMDRRNRNQLEITNQSRLTKDEINSLYKKTGALIYPSRLESLGLPLIEAVAAGLPVIASELDYVRDLLDPTESFNPESPVSISRAVKRFLNIEEQHVDIVSGKEFIQQLLINESHLDD